jgi:hypothetical protein
MSINPYILSFNIYYMSRTSVCSVIKGKRYACKENTVTLKSRNTSSVYRQIMSKD